MDESLRAQIDQNLAHLDALIGRGRRIREALARDPSDKSTQISNRVWQQDIGLAVHQLSGGSKQHWLSRAFSEAFLMRSSAGEVIEGAEPAEIAERLIAVLERGMQSLAQMAESGATAATASVAPPPRRFEFVHNAELRPVLDQAYAESRDAFDAGRYEEALINACGVLEAIVTDALEFRRVDSLADATDLPGGKIAEWSFEERLNVAERSQIIHSGCARLPEIARKYRDLADANGKLAQSVTEQEARRTTQVLYVIMKDLDPGR